MANLAVPTTLYTTDEDLAIRAPADFAAICPKDQVRARGTDGVFGAGDRWTLSSATVDFVAQGVTAGNVVVLSGKPLFAQPEILAVDSVGAGGVTLRRKGESTGVGQPPGPVGGGTAIAFAIPTLQSQIARATYEINRRYGIDPNVVSRDAGSLYDPDELRDVTALTVLVRQFEGMAWAAGDGRDHFTAQSKRFACELQDLLDRVEVHWKPISLIPSTSRFSTRLGRG